MRVSCRRIFLLLFFCSYLIPFALFASAGNLSRVSQTFSVISCAGLGYVAYRGFNYCRNYWRQKIFNDALLSLKRGNFWGNDPCIAESDIKSAISMINSLASSHYRPACIYQAEHPWIFVDGIISQEPPELSPYDFYNRYANYSIASYISLNDAEGFYRAGCLGLAHVYSKYNQGAPFCLVAADICQACVYLDIAARKGDYRAPTEIARLYREGILLPYDEKMAHNCLEYYATMREIKHHMYPLSVITAWLYKTYYETLHGSPVPRQ